MNAEVARGCQNKHREGQHGEPEFCCQKIASRGETLNKDNESVIESKQDEARLKELYRASRYGEWTWQATGTVSGLAGAVVAVFLGTLLSAGAWVLGDETSGMSLHGVGSILLLSTIPLLLIGGYCLDLLDSRTEKIRWINADSAEKRTIHKLIENMRLKEYQKHARFNTLIALIAPLFLFLLCGAFQATQAQQTIFNVPSTDVLDKGKIYGELDVSLKPNNSETVNRFSSFVPRVVVGTGGRVEIGLNITGNIQPGADTTTLVPAFKWKPYQGKDNGISIVVGDNVYIPIRNRGYNAGNYVYAEISKTFKKGTRLTAGGYDFTKNVVSTSNRAGGQFGFEQPVSKTVTLAADYFTGKTAAGYFTPGVVFKVGAKTTGYAGYSIGNQNPSRGNNFFLLEVGYNFN